MYERLGGVGGGETNDIFFRPAYASNVDRMIDKEDKP